MRSKDKFSNFKNIDRLKNNTDNIRLRDLGKDDFLTAAFELQSITLQGNCADKKGSPPRGLQVNFPRVFSRFFCEILLEFSKNFTTKKYTANFPWNF